MHPYQVTFLYLNESAVISVNRTISLRELFYSQEPVFMQAAIIIRDDWLEMPMDGVSTMQERVMSVSGPAHSG